jgi:hypothetical protein
MMRTMHGERRYWRVIFTAAGTVDSVVELDGPPDVDWVIVEAGDESEARAKAFRDYCARKTRGTRARYKQEGRCRCGRARDHHNALTGTLSEQCSVCVERHKVWNHEFRKERRSKKRDEPARIAVNLERQRDRRAEIRIEVLLEVRKEWQKALTNGSFTQWLEREIKALTGKGVAA